MQRGFLNNNNSINPVNQPVPPVLTGQGGSLNPFRELGEVVSVRTVTTAETGVQTSLPSVTTAEIGVQTIEPPQIFVDSDLAQVVILVFVLIGIGTALYGCYRLTLWGYSKIDPTPPPIAETKVIDTRVPLPDPFDFLKDATPPTKRGSSYPSRGYTRHSLVDDGPPFGFDDFSTTMDQISDFFFSIPPIL